MPEAAHNAHFNIPLRMNDAKAQLCSITQLLYIYIYIDIVTDIVFQDCLAPYLGLKRKLQHLFNMFSEPSEHECVPPHEHPLQRFFFLECFASPVLRV